MFEDPYCVLDEDPPTDGGLSDVSALGMADKPSFRWRTGKKITIKFLRLTSDYNSEQVKKYASEWVAPGVANLDFKWVSHNEDAFARVKFTSGRGWSQSRVGMNCRNIFHQQYKPTVELIWPSDASERNMCRYNQA
ncbi:hypothetical protein C8J56DRAFT_897397 [Mycena floridula]|nr:hypothetical protein C8J56DRAFT_897397 [Mycena floridula]